MSLAIARPPLRVVSPFMMRVVLAELETARLDGYAVDEIARHLGEASAGALGPHGSRGERYRLAAVLRAWAERIEADANALPLAMDDATGHA